MGLVKKYGIESGVILELIKDISKKKTAASRDRTMLGSTYCLLVTVFGCFVLEHSVETLNPPPVSVVSNAVNMMLFSSYMFVCSLIILYFYIDNKVLLF